MPLRHAAKLKALFAKEKNLETVIDKQMEPDIYLSLLG
jgi:hypothetical protein